jgi:transposase
MKFIQGKDRDQTEFFCLNQAVSQDNEVRLIDLFIGSIKLSDFGFNMNFIENGRPAYHPSDLLKLFIYGYLNRIRSSRQLEKECKRNIEVMWLMKGLVPDHNTISNFRKDNPKAIRKVFHATVALAKNFDLIGGKLLAGDGTKLRAQNSKKNNFTYSKIERHIAYIDDKLNEYSSILANEDKDLTQEKKVELQSKINNHKRHKDKYEGFKKQLDETGEVQVSTSDPESRQMITRNNVTEVAYNVQSTVDAKHNLPIDFNVTNKNDSKAMGAMTRRAKTILGHTDFTFIFDKGYHTGTEFDYAHKHGVEVIVAFPDVASHAPDISFDVEHFNYNKEHDQYTCPAGELLTTNGRWYNKASGKTINRVKHYKTKACLTCSLFERCTRNKSGRFIERSEHMDLIDANKKRIQQNMELYRKRQAIVEHPFGIIKRQWDFYYIMTKKSMKHASADVGLIFTCYNLRRIMNLVDKNQLKKFLRELAPIFLILTSYFKPLRRILFFRNNAHFILNNLLQVA